MTTVKTIALTAWTFVSKMMFLLFNTQSSFVIAFLPSSKYLLKNFMAAVTICSDFGTQENRICHCFHFFPLFAMKWWDQMPWSFFECWVLSQLFHAPLSLLSWSSLVPLHFLPLEQCRLCIWGCWYFSRQSWFQLVIHPVSHFCL